MTDQLIEQDQPFDAAAEPAAPRPSFGLMVGGIAVVTFAIVGVVTFIALQLILTAPKSDAAAANEALAASGITGVQVIRPAQPVADFTLVSHTGEPLSLSDFRGQQVVLFFGYTHCPDVCPLTMNEVREVQTLLENPDEVAFVFVSVDGERDTPQIIARFLNTHNVAVTGLVGEAAVLETIQPDYGLYYQLNRDEGQYYTVDHTASMFWLNEAGELVGVFAYGTRAEDIAAVLQQR